jgi:hypothetical protein
LSAFYDAGADCVGDTVEWHLDFHNTFSHEEFHFAAWHH